MGGRGVLCSWKRYGGHRKKKKGAIDGTNTKPEEIRGENGSKDGLYVTRDI